MANTVGINLKLPEKTSLEIDRLIIDFKEKGIRLTKAELILKAIHLGLKEVKK